MTLPTSNQPPNDGPVDQPLSRLDELLADRAAGALGEGDGAELRRLLASAGKAEDESLDLAAAACSRALNPHDSTIELPASLLAALDREAEAWSNGVHSHDHVAGRIHEPGWRSDVGKGHALRTPYKRFMREYGGWFAAAACLCFGVYAWNNRAVAPAPSAAPPVTTMSAGLTPAPLVSAVERAVERVDRWMNSGSKIDVVPLGSATPDASADVAVGQVMWNPEEGSGVLQIKPEATVGGTHAYRVSVRCAKSGRQVTVETGSVTLQPGQKDVVVPITPGEALKGSAAFVVSLCSTGPLGVTQCEGVVGLGGAVGESAPLDGSLR